MTPNSDFKDVEYLRNSASNTLQPHGLTCYYALEFSKIFNDTERRAASLRQLSFLLQFWTSDKNVVPKFSGEISEPLPIYSESLMHVL